MKPLGVYKRQFKRHPHNECSVCAENKGPSKGREKNNVKKQIEIEKQPTKEVE